MCGFRVRYSVLHISDANSSICNTKAGFESQMVSEKMDQDLVLVMNLKNKGTSLMWPVLEILPTTVALPLLMSYLKTSCWSRHWTCCPAWYIIYWSYSSSKLYCSIQPGNNENINITIISQPRFCQYRWLKNNTNNGATRVNILNKMILFHFGKNLSVTREFN